MKFNNPDDQLSMSQYDVAVQMGTPPTIPQSVVYTPYYCEENVYVLAQELLQDPKVTLDWNIFVVFVSNPSKTVRLS